MVTILYGCGFNSIKKTTDLYPGMTMQQVKSVMGDPGGTQFIEGKLVWKYYLQKPWLGYIPHYFIFEGDELKMWVSDMNEYNQMQQQWGEAAKSMHEQQKLNLEEEKLRHDMMKPNYPNPSVIIID